MLSAMAMVPEMVWEQAMTPLGFPSYRCVKRIRAAALAKAGLTPGVLNGSFEHVREILGGNLSSEGARRRACLSIDAISTTAAFSVDDGVVERDRRVRLSERDRMRVEENRDELEEVLTAAGLAPVTRL
jgi:hypothetical protein